MARIMLGISGWGEPDLARSGFYPAEAKTTADRLRHYSTRFSVAEIDSTYHSFATARSIATWLDNTPDGFVFNLKAFSMFTQHPTPYQALPRSFREKYGDRIEAKPSVYLHHLPEEAIDDLWQGLGRTAAALQEKGRLGAVLFQFPPWFHPGPENYQYIAGCRSRLQGLPLAVEFRVGSWLDSERIRETLDLLQKNELALVCVDEPQGFKSSVPPVAAATASPAIVRFHGRNGDNWEQKGSTPEEKFNYMYTRDELMEWVDKIHEMAGKADTVHVIFKNKPNENAVANVLEMKELLRLV